MSSMEAHLNETQRGAIRDELQRSLTKLERSLGITEVTAGPVQLDQSVVGRLSRVDTLQNQAMAKSLRERVQVQLAALTDALDRLERGEFGDCVTCGSGIAYERLLVFPESTTCQGCATGE